MISCFGVSHGGRFSLKSAAAVSTVIAGLAIGGCSADVTRFDSASFNLDDPSDARPIPSEPIRTSSLNDNQVVGSAPRGPYGAGASSVQVAALPDAGPSYQPPPSYSPPAYTPPPAYAPPARSYGAQPFGRPRSEVTPIERVAPQAPATASGDAIIVQPGDTLYSLSRAHHVSLDEMMSTNALSNPNVHPGQKLYLPADGSARTMRSSVAAARAVESARPSPAPLAQPPQNVAANYNATYTVKPGESLYSIARAHNAKFAELQQVNGITDPRRVKPGVVLKVPGGAGANAPTSQQVSTPPPSVAATAPAAVVPPLAATEKGSDIPAYGQSLSTQPTIINGEHRVASLTDKASDATPAPPPAAATPPVASAETPASTQPTAVKPEQPKPEQKVALAAPAAASAIADSVKLRWPTTGRIIAGFGGRPDGTHNDGINLAVPLGTEVHAAESGVVAYAGNELKGYGNLVLLRHDNGWVTAYAHNDELLVKRGDKVKRGQVIAKAGKTGSVDQPQVHFELRQGSRPVDPTPYLEKL
ncbi:peptidase M23 [Hyphomicrobium denitrificans 1NES1]|uniref:Peptidase M23 n=1 Tax=Hyphomicrobium denitrificans 1NES1 TaxID=670307 RepID=N0B252_9HYPH|nr:M23 family metallopeptidase [Hyphomicrobium denitrificans]AGK57549.1 peptidase M23 [Hyphomicrobium denitrificans 1NES1]